MVYMNHWISQSKIYSRVLEASVLFIKSLKKFMVLCDEKYYFCIAKKISDE